MQYTHEHLEIQKTLRRFIDEEINPHVDAWEEAEIFPAHEVFKKLGNLGMLAYFKYVGFFLDSLHSLGVGSSLPVWKVLAPIGITVDVAGVAVTQ